MRLGVLVVGCVGGVVLASVLAPSVGGTIEVARVATTPLLHVRVPPAGGFTVERFTLYAKPGAQLPRRLLLGLVNRTLLPKTLVMVALSAPLVGKRPGFDLFVAAITKRATRKASATSDEEPRDATLAILSALNDYPANAEEVAVKQLELFGTAEKYGLPYVAKRIDKGLDALVANPNSNSAFLDGPAELSPEAKALIHELVALLDTGTRSPPTKTDFAEIGGIIANIEAMLNDDLDGDGTIGAPTPLGPKPPPPGKLVRYAFSGLGISFDGVVGGGVTQHDDLSKISGSVCGNPLTTAWALIGTLTIQQPQQPTITLPITGAYDAATPNGDVLFRADVGGGSSMTVKLQYIAGATPQMRILGVPVGAITNIVVSPAQVPVTATSVAAC